MSDTQISNPKLIWDHGTAYELFVSLQVMHQPDHYGVRASWAAGIRSRIPAPERKLLEEVIPFLWIPICGLLSLDLSQPKNAASMLDALSQLPAEQRILRLLCPERWKEPYKSTLLGIFEKQGWDENDLEVFSAKASKTGKKGNHEEKLKTYLNWLSQPAHFGDAFLKALHAYHLAFFEEEEKRVAPILKAAVEHAKALSAKNSLPELLATLSQGVQFDEPITAHEIILIPAYWTTPLIIYDELTEKRMLFMFGARPAHMSAIPGEPVPDTLVRNLKALADPTRLKILSYLSKEQLTPSELARRLRLRAPTVTHHLNDLRLAGLVKLALKGQEKRYRIRAEALENTFNSLKNFLDSPAAKE